MGAGVVWVLYSLGLGRGCNVGEGGFAVGGCLVSTPCIVVDSVVSGLLSCAYVGCLVDCLSLLFFCLLGVLLRLVLWLWCWY